MGELGDQLRTTAGQVDQVEANSKALGELVLEQDQAIAEQAARIVTLEQRLADCEEPTPEPEPEPEPALELVYSLNPNRADPKPLHGATVAGSVYVFTRPDAGVTSMIFDLDDGEPRGEANAPFDLMGGTMAAAKPLDTTKLAEGFHHVDADPEPGDSVRATFTVHNVPAPPDPPPTPPPVVVENYPAVPGTAVSATPATIDAVLNQRPASIVLESGLFAEETFTGRTRPGQQIMARTPGKAVFRVTGTNDCPPFLTDPANGLRLFGLRLENYMRARFHTHDMTAVIDRTTGIDVEIGWCEFVGTHSTFIELGPGYKVHDNSWEQAHVFALRGGGKVGTKMLQRNKGRWLGILPNGQEVLRKEDGGQDTNRGFCKFAITKGIRIDGLDLQDCYQGPWWDIENEDGELKNYTADRIQRTAVNLEISWGPFKISKFHIRHAGLLVRGTEAPAWGAPGGVVFSLTPGCEVFDGIVEDSRTGVTGIQWAHNNQNIQWGKLGLANENVHDITARRIERIAFGYTGSRQPGTLPESARWTDCTYDSGSLAQGTMVNVRKVAA